jgi:hypothetical protein
MAEARNISVPAIFAMSAAEYSLWVEYYQRNGWAADRIVHTAANAGAASARAWGSKVNPDDLVAEFRRRRTSPAVLISKLSAIPGAKSTRLSKEEIDQRRKARRERRSSNGRR